MKTFGIVTLLGIGALTGASFEVANGTSYEKVNDKIIKVSTPIEVDITSTKEKLLEYQQLRNNAQIKCGARIQQQIDLYDKKISELQTIIDEAKKIGVE